MTFKFFSDVNLDSFVQSIALFGAEIDANTATGEVSVTPANEQIVDLADNWGGVIIDA